MAFTKAAMTTRRGSSVAAGDRAPLSDHRSIAVTTRVARARRDTPRSNHRRHARRLQCARAPAESSPAAISSRSRATSPIDWKRFAGSFRRQRWTSFSRSAGRPGTTSRGGGGSCSSTAASVAAAESPLKAIRPVTISYSTAPKLKTSERASAFFPSACSGDM